MKVKYKRSKLDREGKWKLVCMWNLDTMNYEYREYWYVQLGPKRFRKTDEWREYKP